jgi:hypothetical protein
MLEIDRTVMTSLYAGLAKRNSDGIANADPMIVCGRVNRHNTDRNDFEEEEEEEEEDAAIVVSVAIVDDDDDVVLSSALFLVSTPSPPSSPFVMFVEMDEIDDPCSRERYNLLLIVIGKTGLLMMLKLLVFVFAVRPIFLLWWLYRLTVFRS